MLAGQGNLQVHIGFCVRFDHRKLKEKQLLGAGLGMISTEYTKTIPQFRRQANVWRRTWR
jgi:hypothetical protein